MLLSFVGIFTVDLGQFYRLKVKVICNSIAKFSKTESCCISPYVSVYAVIFFVSINTWHDLPINNQCEKKKLSLIHVTANYSKQVMTDFAVNNNHVPSVCVCMFVCTCVRDVCVRVCVCVFVRMCLYVFMYVFVCLFLFLCVCFCECVCVCVYVRLCI